MNPPEFLMFPRILQTHWTFPCRGAPETVMLHENINDNHLNNLYCYGYYRSNIIDFQQFRYKD